MAAPPLCAKPLPHTKSPQHAIPRGACDCHFHVFDQPSRQVPGRSYTAPHAPLAEYRKVQAVLGLDRAVIVQPSVYGTDNQTTLRALPVDGSMKAVVVVDDTTRRADLAALAGQGVVGARVNVLFSSNARIDSLETLARRLADLGLHLQILADVSTLPQLKEFVRRLPVPVVFDHMGHVPARKGVDDPGFQALLSLLETGQVWVKLSGAYRIAPRDMRSAGAMAKALIATNPDRLVWGSDWPHPALQGPMPDDGDLLDMLFDWAKPEVARRILVDNPAELYRFKPWDAADAPSSSH